MRSDTQVDGCSRAPWSWCAAWSVLVLLGACGDPRTPTSPQGAADVAIDAGPAGADGDGVAADGWDAGAIDTATLTDLIDAVGVDSSDDLGAPSDVGSDSPDTAKTCSCGDGVCDASCGEAQANCPKDCAVCGDGVCVPGESPVSCPVDCCGACGDGACKGGLCNELPATCPIDCNQACGNGICDPGENPGVCAVDCLTQVCGNGVCEPADGGPILCPTDCATTCGQCVCDKGEDWSTCPHDCGYCGDGTCSGCGNLGEDVTTCPADCSANCGSCDDGVTCTVDYCGAKGSCVHQPNPASCSDGNPCTLDACSLLGCDNGIDLGACSDNNPCTDDACDAAKGCAHVANSATCNDGDPCTSGDQCAGGICTGFGTCPDAVGDVGADASGGADGEVEQDVGVDSQPDANPCVCGDGACVATCGETVSTCAKDCLACGDGVCAAGESPTACFVDCCGTCGDGKCKGYACGESPSVCPLDCGTGCGNGVCEKGESPSLCPIDCQVGVCGNGVCEAQDGGPALCPQDCGNACGNCICDKGEDFVGCPVDCGWCGDGVCSPCASLGETFALCAADCKAPACAGGCDDGVPCTADTCSADGACTHLPNSSACGDGDACTDDLCDAAKGCLHPFNAGPCDDGNPCTSGDSCWQGACAGSGTCNDAGGSDAGASDLGGGLPDAGSTDSGGGADVAPADVGVDAGPDGIDVICLATCGDGLCTCAETALNCGIDCKACGDGACTPGEGPGNCPEDCCGGCGDGLCKGFACGESTASCPADCGSTCGNLACEKGESPSTCPQDCKTSVCGNGVCEPSDGGTAACPQDCGTACGNCVCDGGEDWLNCPVDCGWCGDGVCSNCVSLGEKGGGCASDCGSPCPGGCDDGVACTQDLCTGPLTCAHLAQTEPCVDSDLCTLDSCNKQSGCVHTAYSCDDANVCTTDTCNGKGGCANPTNGGPCEDGDACTLGDTCVGLVCQTVAKDCNDGSPCTADACIQGGCVHSGSCNLDLVVPFAIDLPGGVTSFSFDGMAGQRVALDGPNTLSQCGLVVAIEGPQGILASAWCVGGQLFLDVATLPVNGVYTLKLAINGGETGSGTVYVHNVPPDPSSPILIDGPPVTLQTTVPTQNMEMTFQGTQGQRIAFTSENDIWMCATSLFLLDPDGKQFFNYGCAGGAMFSDLLVLPADGVYTLRLDPSGMSVGTWKVTLISVPLDLKANTAVDAAPLTLKTTGPAQNAEITFQGTKDQRIAFTSANEMWMCGAVVHLYDPSGGDLYANGCAGGTFFSDLLVLPESGEYKVFFDPGGAATGPWTLDVMSVPETATATIAVDGGPVTVQTVGPGQNMEMTMQGTKGQRIAIENMTDFLMCSAGFNLYDPTGASIYGNGCAGGPTFTDLIVLPSTGTYALRVDPYGGSVGSWTAKVFSVPADAMGVIEVDGPPVTLAATVGAQNLEMTMQGTKGQRIAIENTTDFPMCSAGFNLYDPTGASIYGNGCAGGLTFTDLIVLPSTGTYVLRVDPYGGGVGTWTAKAFSVPADESGSTQVDGPSVTLATTVPSQNLEMTMQGTKGQRIAIENTTDFPMCSAGFNLYDPTGASIYGNGCSGGATFTDLIVLPATGTYSLRVDPYGGGVGTWTAKVFSVPADASGLIEVDGPSVSLATTVPSQNMALKLQGSQGQRIAIENTTDFPMCSAAFNLHDPSGESIYANGCSGGPTFTDLIVLPSTGTYVLRIDPGVTGVGGWKATAWNVPPDLTGALQVGGAPYVGKIAKGGQNGALQINVSDLAGFALQVSNTAPQCSFYLAVKAPSGEVVQANGCAGGDTTMTLTGLTQSGTYTVVFDPAGMEQPDIQIKAVGL